MVKYESVNNFGPFYFVLCFHWYEKLIFFSCQNVELNVSDNQKIYTWENILKNQRTVMHVFLSGNDVLEKLWCIKFCKFNQNSLNCLKHATGKNYSSCKVQPVMLRHSYVGGREVDNKLRGNFWFFYLRLKAGNIFAIWTMQQSEKLTYYNVFCKLSQS